MQCPTRAKALGQDGSAPAASALRLRRRSPMEGVMVKRTISNAEKAMHANASSRARQGAEADGRARSKTAGTDKDAAKGPASDLTGSASDPVEGKR